MNGDQIILLAVVATLALPASVLGAARACARHMASGKGYVAAYLATLLAAVLAAVVLHLLPQLPAIWRTL